MGIYDEDDDDEVIETKALEKIKPARKPTAKSKKPSSSVRKKKKVPPKKKAPPKKKTAPKKKVSSEHVAPRPPQKMPAANVKKTITQTPDEFFSSVKPKPEYIKHLVSCRCYLPQFKEMEIPPDHRFVVFSEINSQGGIDPHYTQCNNCGLIHKVFEVGVSHTLKKESMLTLPRKDDVATNLPEWMVALLQQHDCELHVYQEAEFILKHKLWGRFVVLAKERDETMLLGKIVQILGDDLYKVETFERDESDVRPK